jgi:predicted nicotinamide N-methyase
MKRLERMSKAELLELQAMVASRLAELEAQEASRTTPEGEARLEASQGGPEGQARARGSIEWKVIKGHGPYAYWRYWEGGRLRSKYLGRNPDLSRLR